MLENSLEASYQSILCELVRRSILRRRGNRFLLECPVDGISFTLGYAWGCFIFRGALYGLASYKARREPCGPSQGTSGKAGQQFSNRTDNTHLDITVSKVMTLNFRNRSDISRTESISRSREG